MSEAGTEENNNESENYMVERIEKKKICNGEVRQFKNIVYRFQLQLSNNIIHYK